MEYPGLKSSYQEKGLFWSLSDFNLFPDNVSHKTKHLCKMIFFYIKFTNMKYKEKLNKRLYKNMENSTYIYYATNAFNEAAQCI